MFTVNLSYKRKFWLFYCKQVSACFILKLGINCVFRSCRNQSLILLGLMRLHTPINCNFVFSRVSRARTAPVTCICPESLLAFFYISLCFDWPLKSFEMAPDGCCFSLGKDDDYEKWIPHGKGAKNGCLLGRKVYILRPKKESL